MGRVLLATLSAKGFHSERQIHSENWAGKRLPRSMSSSLGPRPGQSSSAWGELTSPATGAQPCPASCGAGEPSLLRAATELGPYRHPDALKKNPLPSAGAPQGKSQDPRAPFPCQGACSEPGCLCPVPLPLLRAFQCTVATRPLPAGMPCGSS